MCFLSLYISSSTPFSRLWNFSCYSTLLNVSFNLLKSTFSTYFFFFFIINIFLFFLLKSSTFSTFFLLRHYFILTWWVPALNFFWCMVWTFNFWWWNRLSTWDVVPMCLLQPDEKRWQSHGTRHTQLRRGFTARNQEGRQNPRRRSGHSATQETGGRSGEQTAHAYPSWYGPWLAPRPYAGTSTIYLG